MSLLDDDLTEKLDIPMIFAAIESLRETMNKNLEEIAVHEKAISALHKNVSTARFELESVRILLDEIVNPKPKYNDTEELQNSELQKFIKEFTTSTDLWYNPANYTTTRDAYDYDTKTIAGI